MDLRSVFAAKSGIARAGTSWRSFLRKREPEAPKGCVLAARAILVLAGVLFTFEGVLLVTAGCVSVSWGFILLGAAIVLASLGVVWIGIQPGRDGVCNAAVALVAELLARILGSQPISPEE